MVVVVVSVAPYVWYGGGCSGFVWDDDDKRSDWCAVADLVSARPDGGSNSAASSDDNKDEDCSVILSLDDCSTS